MAVPCLAVVQRALVLLEDNRRLRRQAQQLQLQAAGEVWPAHTAAQVSAQTAGTQQGQVGHPQPQQQNTTQLQPQQQLQDGNVSRDHASAADGEPGATAAESSSALAAAAATGGGDAEGLREALTEAEQHLAVLREENERLMDLSNGLRAENQGLKQALSVQVRTRG